MFKTFSNTWELMGVSWRLLNTNRALVALPAISGAVSLVILLISVGVLSTGTALDTASSGDPNFGIADYIFFAAIYFAVSFTVIYFNAALVSGAYDLLAGGKPTVANALDGAYAQLPTIFGWACFTTTIGLIIERIRSGGGVFAIAGWILDAIWAYATYFVVPVLVIEGLSPFDALKRSTGLIDKTWGKALVANFGFGIAYLLLAVVAVLPVVVAFTMSTGFGIAAAVLYGAPLLIGGILVLFTMEGIFRTALYVYATTGDIAGGFNERMLRRAYVNKDERGTW